VLKHQLKDAEDEIHPEIIKLEKEIKRLNSSSKSRIKGRLLAAFAAVAILGSGLVGGAALTDTFNTDIVNPVLNENEAVIDVNDDKIGLDNHEVLIKFLPGDKMPDGSIYVSQTWYSGNNLMFTTPQDAPGIYNWEQAQAYCETLEAHGRNDWRVPHSSETWDLQEIQDAGALKGTFSTTALQNYWTENSFYGAGITSFDGDVNSIIYSEDIESETAFLRCIQLDYDVGALLSP